MGPVMPEMEPTPILPSPPSPSRISVVIAKLRTMPSIAFARLGSFNTWIAAKLHTTRERIVQIELGGLFALGFTLMQIGEWAASVASWVLLACIFFAKALAWEGIEGQKGLTALLRFSGAFGAIAVCVLLVTITDLHKPDNEPWSNLQKLWPHKVEKAELSLSALATNIGYQEKANVAGIEWNKEYADVRIVIKSHYRYPMLNLDVTVQTMEPNELFEAMAQTSSISGVEFHNPPPPIEFPDIKILGKNGERGSVKPDFDEAMAKMWKSGTWYRIYCPRLEPDDKLTITAVTWKPNAPGIAPLRLKMTGNYETIPSEGSKRIPIEQIVEVKR
jgi:hypothetical protein